MVDRNGRLAKRVGLFDSPELYKTLDRSLEIVSHAIGLGSCIESKRPVKLVGVPEVAPGKQLGGAFPFTAFVRAAPIAPPTDRTVPIIITITTRRRTLMLASRFGGLFRQACRRQGNTPFSITFRPRCS